MNRKQIIYDRVVLADPSFYTDFEAKALRLLARDKRTWKTDVFVNTVVIEEGAITMAGGTTLHGPLMRELRQRNPEAVNRLPGRPLEESRGRTHTDWSAIARRKITRQQIGWLVQHLLSTRTTGQKTTVTILRAEIGFTCCRNFDPEIKRMMAEYDAAVVDHFNWTQPIGKVAA